MSYDSFYTIQIKDVDIVVDNCHFVANHIDIVNVIQSAIEKKYPYYTVKVLKD